MRTRVVGCALFVLIAGSSAAVVLAQDCPVGKPTVLTKSLGAALGQSPAWVIVGRGPLDWVGPGDPVQLLWVLDNSAPGQASAAGKHWKTGAVLKFTKFGDRLSERQTRFLLNPAGYRPKQATAEDLKKYGFDLIYGWFPEPGCYELVARVGRQQSTLHLEVVKAKEK